MNKGFFLDTIILIEPKLYMNGPITKLVS